MRQHDCGSTSCKFATARNGQRNNGPCRCMRDSDARIDGLEEVLRDLVDATDGVLSFAGAPLIQDKKGFDEYASKAYEAISRAEAILKAGVEVADA